MTPRMRDAVDYLAREYAVTRDEFREHFKDVPGRPDMLLEATLALSYAAERKGKISLTDAGIRAQREALGQSWTNT